MSTPAKMQLADHVQHSSSKARSTFFMANKSSSGKGLREKLATAARENQREKQSRRNHDIHGTQLHMVQVRVTELVRTNLVLVPDDKPALLPAPESHEPHEHEHHKKKGHHKKAKGKTAGHAGKKPKKAKKDHDAKLESEVDHMQAQMAASAAHAKANTKSEKFSSLKRADQSVKEATRLFLFSPEDVLDFDAVTARLKAEYGYKRAARLSHFIMGDGELLEEVRDVRQQRAELMHNGSDWMRVLNEFDSTARARHIVKVQRICAGIKRPLFAAKTASGPATPSAHAAADKSLKVAISALSELALKPQNIAGIDDQLLGLLLHLLDVKLATVDQLALAALTVWRLSEMSAPGTPLDKRLSALGAVPKLLAVLADGRVARAMAGTETDEDREADRKRSSGDDEHPAWHVARYCLGALASLARREEAGALVAAPKSLRLVAGAATTAVSAFATGPASSMLYHLLTTRAEARHNVVTELGVGGLLPMLKSRSYDTPPLAAAMLGVLAEAAGALGSGPSGAFDGAAFFDSRQTAGAIIALAPLLADTMVELHSEEARNNARFRNAIHYTLICGSHAVWQLANLFTQQAPEAGRDEFVARKDEWLGPFAKALAMSLEADEVVDKHAAEDAAKRHSVRALHTAKLFRQYDAAAALFNAVSCLSRDDELVDLMHAHVLAPLVEAVEKSPQMSVRRAAAHSICRLAQRYHIDELLDMKVFERLIGVLLDAKPDNAEVDASLAAAVMVMCGAVRTWTTGDEPSMVDKGVWRTPQLGLVLDVLSLKGRSERRKERKVSNASAAASDMFNFDEAAEDDISGGSASTDDDGAGDDGAPAAAATPQHRNARDEAFAYAASVNDRPDIVATLAAPRKRKKVLLYVCIGLVRLSCRKEHRRLLGELHAQDGLVDLARQCAASTDVALIEAIVAGLWLISFDEKNAVRMALRGGLHLLVDVLKWPRRQQTVFLKMQCVGALWQMALHDDIRVLMHQFSVMTILHDLLLWEEPCAAQLRSSCLWMLCTLEGDELHAKTIAAEHGRWAMLDLCLYALRPDLGKALHVAGLFALQRITAHASGGRQRICQTALPLLSELLRAGDKEEALMVLHLLMNASTDKTSHLAIAKALLRALLAVAHSTDPSRAQHAEFALGTLANISKNSHVRQILYRIKLTGASESYQRTRPVPQVTARAAECAQRAAKTAVLDFTADPAGLAQATGTSAMAGSYDDWMHKTWVDTHAASPLARDGLPADSPVEAIAHAAAAAALAREPVLDEDRDAATAAMSALRSAMVEPVTGLWEHGKAKVIDAQHGAEGAKPAFVVRSGDSTSVTPQAYRLKQWESLPNSRKTFKNHHGHGQGHGHGHRFGKSAAVLTPIKGGGGGGGARPQSAVSSRRGRAGGGAPAAAASARPRSASGARRMTRMKASQSASALQQTPTPTTWLNGTHAQAQFDQTQRSQAEAAAAAAADDATDASLHAPLPLVDARAWSHRIGPPGEYGSTETEYGEYRWNPRIREVRRAVSAAAAETGETDPIPTLVIEPGGHRNSVAIRQTLVARRTKASVKLSFWRAHPGSKIGQMLYPSFDLDGQTYHVYHTSDIPSEALDPGDLPRPQAPTMLLHDFVEAFHAVAPPKPGAMPLPPMPPRPAPPDIEAPALPFIREYRSFDHSEQARPLGELPATVMWYLVEEELPQVDGHLEAKKVWGVADSVFKPRLKESDSKQAWNTKKFYKGCFEKDWMRFKDLPRGKKFLDAHDKEAVRRLKHVFASEYEMIYSVYEYYSANMSPASPWSMSMGGWNTCLAEMEVVDEHCTSGLLDKIFVMVNVEENRGAWENDANDDKCLMRHEWMEALIRIAETKYCGEQLGADALTVDRALKRLLSSHFEGVLPTVATYDMDSFRHERLYFEEVDAVYKKYHKDLSVLYAVYSEGGGVAGASKFGVDQWIKLLSNSACLNDEVSRMEAVFLFVWSRMRITDELFYEATRVSSLTFCDFLEVLARLADTFCVPDEAQMAEVPHAAKGDPASLLTFYESATKATVEERGRALERRPSSVGFISAKTQPLARKLDLVLKYLLGNLAIGIGGAGEIVDGKRRRRRLGVHLTKDQKEQYNTGKRTLQATLKCKKAFHEDGD